ncbi:MAG: hypothetical protein PHT07_08340 [Paludibacter sp.]|nr:hypothetical protein [Paludibacter sp.]
MKKIIYFPMFILLFVCGVLFTQCKTTDNGPVVTTTYLINLSNSATLGSYLTDKNGYALYFFANDANGANNCTGGCLTNWPIFNIDNLTQDQLGAGLLVADFKSIVTPTGTQLTYKGWPLYYYAPAGIQDATGMTNGNGVGGVWFVAKPDYTIMLAKMQLVGADTKNYIVSPSNVYSVGTGLTTYFTDLMGRTLYSFSPDSANINKYTTADPLHNATWPIYPTDKAVVPSVLDKTLFGSITVFGNKQLTYKGWPMYYFKNDVDANGNFRGSNKGVSVPVPGKWPVFFKDYPAAPTK